MSIIGLRDRIWQESLPAQMAAKPVTASSPSLRVKEAIISKTDLDCWIRALLYIRAAIAGKLFDVNAAPLELRNAMRSECATFWSMTNLTSSLTLR